LSHFINNTIVQEPYSSIINSNLNSNSDFDSDLDLLKTDSGFVFTNAFGNRLRIRLCFFYDVTTKRTLVEKTRQIVSKIVADISDITYLNGVFGS